jgi:hypothetical protein
MLELISIVCSLVLLVLTPIEVRKIRAGWVREKFKGDRGRFIAAYRKQLMLLTWLGVVFGVLTVGLAFIQSDPGESTIKIVAGLIWLAVACVCFVSRGMIPDEPSSGSPRDSGA